MTIRYVRFFLCLPFALLHAGTAVDQELALLQQQREKATATAIEPIERRYQESLEKMLSRALQAKDIEGSMKIQAEIASLPKEIAKQLAGTWALRASNGYTADITFRSDGSGTHPLVGKFQWHINGGILFTKTNEAELDHFYLPIRDGMLKGFSFNTAGLDMTITKKAVK